MSAAEMIMDDAAVENQRFARLAWGFVFLGLTARLVRYLLRFPLWADEYQLADNYLSHSFADLFAPLAHNQVAPLGFSWIELAAVRCLGFSEWSLRLFPIVCGIASLFLFRHLASRLLVGLPFALAVGVFSVAYYPIRYSVEAKPYASDLFFALVLLLLAVEWWRRPHDGRFGFALCLAAPVAMLISFPAVFVAGAVGLGTLLALETTRRSEGRLPRKAFTLLALYGGLLLASFFGLSALNASAQYQATRDDMLRCWADGFPPTTGAVALLNWLLMAHTGWIFAYPLGGEHGASAPCFLAFAAGTVFFWRSGSKPIVLTTLAMLGLSLVAAAMQRYPYGSHARLSQYMAPALCLMIGQGIAGLMGLAKSDSWQRVARRAVLAGCALIALVTVARDLVRPYKDPRDQIYFGFARWFWSTEGEGALCVASDLGYHVYDGSFETAYRCYRQILTGHRQAARDEILSRLDAASEPVRCVVFHSASATRNAESFDRWMKVMLSRYELVSVTTHQVPLARRGDAAADYYLQCYDDYHFDPLPKTPGKEPDPSLTLTGEEQEPGSVAHATGTQDTGPKRR
jgi:Dolichyl-phosphate-mannose-protein mannosyltransferase